MNLNEFKDKATATKFNNCNGWGFGGRYGTNYVLGIFTLSIGKYSSRHQGSWKSDKYYIEGQYDVSKEKFLKAISEL